MKQQGHIQVGTTVLDGEIVYEATDKPIITAEELQGVNEFLAELHKVCATTGIFLSSSIVDDSIVDGSIVEPVTDPARLLGTERGEA